MKVAGAAKIGVFADGGRFSGMAGCFVACDERADAFAGQPADLDGAGRDGLSLGGADGAVESENPEAGSEPLFRMRPAGKDRDDQALGVRPDRCGPAPEAFRRPFGISAMRTRHAIRIGPEA